MPEPLGTGFYIECLNRVGILSCDGASPLPWSDLIAWNMLMQLDQSELEMIRYLSFAYADQMYKSKDVNCPPPLIPENLSRKEIAKKVGKVFKQLAKSQQRKKNGLSRTRV